MIKVRDFGPTVTAISLIENSGGRKKPFVAHHIITSEVLFDHTANRHSFDSLR